MLCEPELKPPFSGPCLLVCDLREFLGLYEIDVNQQLLPGLQPRSGTRPGWPRPRGRHCWTLHKGGVPGRAGQPGRKAAWRGLRYCIPGEMGVELLFICPGWDLAQLFWGAGLPILSGNWQLHTQAACVFQASLLAAWGKKGRKRLGVGEN